MQLHFVIVAYINLKLALSTAFSTLNIKLNQNKYKQYSLLHINQVPITSVSIFSKCLVIVNKKL